VAVGPGEHSVAVGGEFDVDPLFVDVGVVPSAKKQQIAVVGGSAVFPVVDVVGVGVADGAPGKRQPPSRAAICRNSVRGTV
jgi:hypothetical protein